MTELRKSIYDINESVEVNMNPKKRCCNIGLVKCFGGIIFLSGTSVISFLLGLKYSNYLNDNDGSL